MSLDTSRLSPSDAAAALRSYPGRFRAGLTGFDDDEDPDALVRRRPPDGSPSALEHAAAAADAMTAVGDAFRRIVTSDGAVVPASLLDAEAAGVPPIGDEAPEAVLARLAEQADGLARRIGATASGDWGRRAQLDGGGGGGGTTALDVVRAAVRAGHHHLRGAERAVRAVRGR